MTDDLDDTDRLIDVLRGLPFDPQHEAMLRRACETTQAKRAAIGRTIDVDRAVAELIPRAVAAEVA